MSEPSVPKSQATNKEEIAWDFEGGSPPRHLLSARAMWAVRAGPSGERPERHAQALLVTKDSAEPEGCRSE
jgi:hypothetical protein